MKSLLKLEEFALLICFSGIYFYYLEGSWSLFLLLFFVPDVSFLAYLVNPAIGAFFYNIMHHKGLIMLFLIIGHYFKIATMVDVSIIFLAHSCFDRLFGYGLKYLDSFEHTHLGWIGKSGGKNLSN
ncbi:MAG: DUF4260 domain-containing protein [Saprospiraceae bacterium]|jgi:hypothetical protein|uniref:DUF4260 domain-containing protein n=1 Tax=Candidatus Brachybacter algidus TaxID=2982024 RepID=UPI001B6F89A3|nr:DUF4260 domain-containing protein [Candidatus Brachybacter algidus]MBP7305053.1 DUF4260 domain-containing protein [Saprospiraceae bacterium]MBK6373134.1 DUF4260 domain-containing protein [Candidatus Brachybacter algidus]MBK6447783.1 DUF4260 domain-containing protein [Candidatus Brachybacter algidus]MBK7602594.1 DUF4260 domain-containing protein [Candidatus Brachybacter algidus]MBK8354744.1 DUF4260 domain-containing protein [Candidatus Brachybacter algidus]